MTPERAQERLARSPELTALVAGLGDRPETAEVFFARADRFAALLASSLLRDLICDELAGLLASPTRTIQDSFPGVWIVAGDRRFELALVTTSEPTDILHGSPRHRLIGVGVPGSVELELFAHAQPHPGDVFDRSLLLAPLGTRSLRSGEVLAQRAWFDVVEPTARAPGHLLSFATAPVDRLRWTYDRATLRPRSPTPTDLAIHRLEYAIGTLLHLGSPDAVEVLAGLATYPAHHIRWSAIRAVTELDPARGRELLAAALADPHPHVRQAARGGLARLAEADREG